MEARAIRKHYGRNLVLDDVSLAVHPGDITTIIGLNGSGKTTLLRILLGLERADAGTIHRKPGLRVGYVPQKCVFSPAMPVSVQEFLRLARADVVDALLHNVCAEMEIEALLKQPVHGLSGGELQRVLLARALLVEPEILVLDEPVQGIDMTGQAELYALIARLSEARHCAVLMVSHDLHLVMAATQHVICLNRHVCCAGHPQQISKSPEFIALFGARVAESLALYTHHHDHRHDMCGHVMEGVSPPAPLPRREPLQ